MTSCSFVQGVLGALLVIAAGAGRVDAQSEDSNAIAERLFNQARELVKANRWVEACPLFEASLRDDPALGTRLNLAACYEHVGQLARAWELYHGSIGIAESAGDPERRDFAQKHADALEPQLARLVISAPARPPAGFRVTRDGAAIDAGALGVAVYVDAGQHEIVASAPGFARFTKVVTLVAAKTETLAIPSLTAAAVSSDGSQLPVDAAEASAGPVVAVSSTRTYIAIGVGAVGVATVGVGFLFGANARSNLGDAKLLCGDRLVCEGNATYRLGQLLIHDARSNATISTVLVAAGGAAIIAGAVVFLTRPNTREPRTARIVPVPQERGAGLAIVGGF
jgi:hypothetical protein